MDDRADDFDVDRLLLAFVQDGDRDRFARLAAQQAHGVLPRQALGAAAVDPQDLVAGPHARHVGRRADQRAHHGQLAALVVVDLHAHAAELLVEALEELGHQLAADIAGIGIVEPVDHPIHGPLEERLLIDILQRTAADLIQNLGQDLTVMVVPDLLVTNQRDDGEREQDGEVAARHG